MENGSYDLVDRIAAREDRGLVPKGGVHNAPAAQRARLPAALKARQNGWQGEVELRRRLHLLEEMLRNVPGINVRMPSHHAAPFRATGFALDVGPLAFDLDGAGTAQKIDLFDTAGTVITGKPSTTLDFGASGGGDSGVPEGFRAVISYVCVASSQLQGSPVVTSPSAANGTVFTLRKNGDPVPGVKSRFPAWFYEAQEIAGVQSDVPQPPRMEQANNLLYAPINLAPGDTLTGEYALPATNAGLANLDSLVWCKVGGYIYPLRVDMDGIGGTLAD